MKRNIIAENETEVVEQLKKEIEKCCKAALSANGVFRVGLSGGSLLNYLSVAIPQLAADDCQLSKWKFFFCDERYVAENDTESTFGAYKSKLLPKTALKVEQFVNINLDLPLEECARDYEHKIRKEFDLLTKNEDVPQFDLLLLGMGPDGHTCSLFPNHTLLQENKLLIAHIADSPKPPPARVTMTLPLINNAKCCIFAMCGASKAEMVKRIFKEEEALPAGLVKPKGELVCIFDKEAGKYLSSK